MPRTSLSRLFLFFIFFIIVSVSRWRAGSESVFVIQHANQWTYDAEQGTQTLSGKVVVTFEDLELRAGSIRLNPDRGKKAILTAMAEGGVEVKQGEQTAKGSTASYDFRSGAMEILGQVQVVRGSDTVRADKIIFSRSSRAMTALGDVSGTFSGDSGQTQRGTIRLEKADSWIFDPSVHRHELSGGVVLTMEDTRISSSRVVLIMDGSDQVLLKAETDPPVEITRGDVWATAKSAVFYPGTGRDAKVVLKGQARLTQGENIMGGEEIIFFPESGQVTGKDVRIVARNEGTSSGTVEVQHADSWTYDPGTQVQSLKGDVCIVYEGLELRAQSVVLTGGQSPEKNDLKAQAEGDVQVVRGDQVARGEKGSYDFGAGILELSGEAQVTQGKNVVRAREISFQKATQAMTAVGDVSGRFSGDNQDAGESMVLEKAERWVFDPKQHLHEIVGDVVLSMQETRISSSRILIYMDQKDQAILKAETEPPMEFAKGDVWATADAATYYPAAPDSEERIVLKGNAKLNQGQDTMLGEEIVFFPKTGLLTGKGVHVSVKVSPEQESIP